MANSPLKQDIDLVSFSIMIDGTELPGDMMIHSIEVKKEINKIPTAVFSILDGDHFFSFFKSIVVGVRCANRAGQNCPGRDA